MPQLLTRERHTYEVQGVHVFFLRTAWGGQWECDRCQTYCEHIQQAALWRAARERRAHSTRLH
jgi:hypothetical protein